MKSNSGYAGRIMRVDLSSGNIGSMSTMDYAEKFVGGKGIAAKIYWDEATPGSSAFDAESPLIFITGPLAGISGLTGSMWKVCGKSPINGPGQFCQCNLGGSWGSSLKLAGWDGIVIQGKSDKLVYLFVEDDTAYLRDASDLGGKGAIDTREILKQKHGDSLRVAACGPAGEKKVVFASLVADGDCTGSAGFGAVMGSKGLKAIAVRGRGKVTPADPDELQRLIKYVHCATKDELLESTQSQMYLGVPGPKGAGMSKKVCWGCSGYGCARAEYQATDGAKGKFMCGSAIFYKALSNRYYGRINWDILFHANRLCDNYGLDNKAISAVMRWLGDCAEAGILTDQNTGIPISRMGSIEFIQTLVEKVSSREGFGDVLAQGIVKAAEIVGGGSGELITDYIVKGMERPGSVEPRLFNSMALLLATEPRTPRRQGREIRAALPGWLDWINHKEGSYVSSAVWRAIAAKFLGSEQAADFSTCEGKALCAKIIQDREAMIQSMIFCGWMWPIMVVKGSDDHAGDPALESRVFSAVTGRKVSEEEFYGVGERIFNLERAIWIREGHKGRESDSLPDFYFTNPLETYVVNRECLVPGKNGEVTTRKGTVLDRKEFEKMKDEYYQLRGWDVASGLQTNAKLRELGLGEIIEDRWPVLSKRT